MHRVKRHVLPQRHEIQAFASSSPEAWRRLLIGNHTHGNQPRGDGGSYYINPVAVTVP